MEIHHDKHHNAYVTNLNAALDGTELDGSSRSRTCSRTSSIVPEDKRTAVRNNGGGHANHSLFWTILGPNGGGEPAGALADAIEATFGAFDDLKEQMAAAGVERFGSGWAWLVWDGNGSPCMSTPNQDSPDHGRRRRSSASTSGSTPTT